MELRRTMAPELACVRLDAQYRGEICAVMVVTVAFNY